jgi:hypothetical protein
MAKKTVYSKAKGLRGARKNTKGTKTVILKKVSQTGSNKSVAGAKQDRKIGALPSGKRKTANPHFHQGKKVKKETTYYERRRNRTDK